MSRTRALKAWLAASDARRQWLWFLLLYVTTAAVLFGVASRTLLTAHTSFNHFAHLAEGWLDGRLDLGGRPPEYARGNDFASYEGKWFVAFPPFPALLLLPLVAFAGDAEGVCDGQVFLWLAALVPVLVFCVLQRLRQLGLSARSEWQNAGLAVLSCFGTVFFFTAEQGTVWFAAHVVGVCLAALYALFAFGAARPFWAGLALGLGSLTRSPLLFAVPLFLLEAVRVSLVRPLPGTEAFVEPGLVGALRRHWLELDLRALLRRWLSFALPVAVCLGFTLWYNWVRFDHPLESGYRFLTVAWQARMEKWGLFDYHYLSRNLGVVFSMLPWSGTEHVPFRINAHGLALWFTTPLYLWTLWPKFGGSSAATGVASAGVVAAERPSSRCAVRWLHWALWLTVAAVAVPTLFYQNTGWAQFGYRFSNDYMVFLFVLLAIGARPMRTLFLAAALWGVLVNSFGAVTFERGKYQEYYFRDSSQTKFYEKD